MINVNLREDGTLEIYDGRAILAEISDVTEDEIDDLVDEYLYESGYNG